MRDMEIAKLIDETIEKNKDHRHCIDCGLRMNIPHFPSIIITKDDMLCRDCRLRHYGPVKVKETKCE